MVEKDRIFLKNFSLLIAGLLVMTLVLILLGAHMNKLTTHRSNPQRIEAVEARIAPIGQTYMGAEGAASVAAISAAIDSTNQIAGAGAPVAPAADAGSEPSAPAAAEIDGGEIFNSVCFACHLAGVAGAPKLETVAWENRITKGVDALLKNAIDGFQGDSGFMPPKGGRLDLSDAQIQVTVQWMLDNLK